MRTPLGLRSDSSAAALRAGISRLGEHPYMIDRLGNPMVAAVDGALPAGTADPERFVALAQSALQEACEPLQSVTQAALRLPLFLGLPEMRPGFSQYQAESVRQGLQRSGEPTVELDDIRLFAEGHAAGAVALEAALGELARGAQELCLVGGIESYFHPDTMEWLDANRQLAGEDGRSAFVPAEGAGFLLLATERACKRLGLARQARVRASVVRAESKLIKTPEVCLGEGLTEAVEQAVAQAGAGGDKRINDILCDINGERYRGQEWGFVCLRLSHYFDDPADYSSPADAWGDMGAASIPLFAMLACQAAARGYAKGPLTLLWASSEGGQRGAVVVETGQAG
ncbi:MAG: hypothetical protein OEZ06_26530 [Myxococcales bacterium]|nr:hypothetical protein [Myxococcales bacterium]